MKYDNNILYIVVPSSPRNVKTKENSQNILQWRRPEVPSGRVEFYEVAITLWYKDEIQRRHISGVINSNECEFYLPVCIDADYRFTIEVRAVNLVRRDTEIDHYIFAMKNISSDDGDYYMDNNDLSCVGTALSATQQQAIMREYRDTTHYVLYESEWEKGPITNCSDPKLSRITMLALLIVVSSLGVMAAFYVARNKYQKMANISCALPPGLEAMAYPIKDNRDDSDDFRRGKDSTFNNESRRLLSSISHDSGYAYHNGDHNIGGLSSIAHCSLGKSSGYVGSDHSTEYCTQETLVAADSTTDDCCIVDQTPVHDDAYMVMDLLKSKNNTLLTLESPTTTLDSMLSQSDKCGNGYVQPNCSIIASLSTTKQLDSPSMIPQMPTSFISADNGYIKQIPPSIHTQVLPSENGYIKPNNFFNWPIENLPKTESISDANVAPSALPISSSGYVAPQLFQKVG